MKKRILVLGVLVVCLLLPLTTMAATEADKRAAIDAGLAWLATRVNGDGSIGGGGTDYKLAQTGSALLAFIEEKSNWGANTAAYQTLVDNGLNYILSQASVVTIGGQPAGNPDVDGNGVGVKLFPGGTNSRDTYVTGIVLPAIAASGTPNKLVTTGALVGRSDGSGAGGAWTYKDVVQNTMDYFAYGQTDMVTGHRGGWRYYANYGNSDQSTAQWPVIAGLYGSLMGASYPGFVGTELDHWISAIQYPDGGAGYYPTFGSPSGTRYGEMNETGALLIEQASRGLGVGNASVDAALNYIDTNWAWSASSWDGNFGNPYAMWAIYKGLELTIGLNDPTGKITPRAQGGAVIDPGDVWTWWEDYCESLVQAQLGDGSWNGHYQWGSDLAVGWYINILAATEIPGPDPIPEPTTILLSGLGLLGAGVWLRRRRKR